MKKYLIEASAINTEKEYSKEELELEFINYREKLLKLLDENIVY